MPQKPRVTPDTGLTPEAGRVAARPTDPFLQFTGNAAGSQLRALASSLSRFGEQGSRFAGQLQEKQQKQQAEEGRQAFLAALEDQENTRDAIKSLEMRPQQSKWFRWGVQAEAGKYDALRARDHFVAGYGDALEGATTLEEFDSIAGEALDAYRGEGEFSEAFDNGFFPSYMAQIENLRYNFATGLDGKLSKMRLEPWGARMDDLIRTTIDDGGSLTVLAAQLQTELDGLYEDNPTDQNEARVLLAGTIATYAQTDLRMDAIQLAKDIKLPNGASLFGQFSDTFRKLEQDLPVMIVSKDFAMNDAIAKNNLFKADAISKDVMALATSTDITDGAAQGKINEMIKVVDSLSPGTGRALRSMVDGARAFVDQTDNTVYESIFSGIYTDRVTAVDIINSQAYLTRSDANTLMSKLISYQNSKKSGTKEFDLLNDKQFIRNLATLPRRFAKGPLGNLTRDSEQRGISAQNELVDLALENVQELSEMTRSEREAWLQTTAQEAYLNNVPDGELSLSGIADPGSDAPFNVVQTDPLPIDQVVAKFGQTEIAAIWSQWEEVHDLTPRNSTEAQRMARWRTFNPNIDPGSPEFWVRIAEMEQFILDNQAPAALPTPQIDTLSGGGE